MRGSIVTRVTLAFAGGIGTGAALMYFLDPDRGARRRALARDKVIHVAHKEREFLAKSARDVQHRGIGLLARLRRPSPDVSDEVLVARVRAELGRHVSHPSSIEVEANDGVVTLSGPVLRDEAGGLIRSTRRIPGVKRVEDRLERHVRGDRVPGLQGEGHIPRPVYRREHLPPAIRLVMSGVGLAAGSYGLMRKGSLGAALVVSGGAALLRAATNLPLRKVFGLADDPEVVTIQKTITVHASIQEVYELWSRIENVAKFMEHVERVRVEDNGRISHWRVRGPGGTRLTWDAELIENVPCERLSWRTIGGNTQHTGTIRFEAIDSQTTRVHMRMAYNPPAGAVGHSIAALLGRDPKRALDEDMLRMKSLLEDGKTVIRGRTVMLDQMH